MTETVKFLNTVPQRNKPTNQSFTTKNLKNKNWTKGLDRFHHNKLF